MEAENDGAGGLGEQDVTLADLAHAAQDDIHPHFRGAQLGEGIGQRFGRAALIGLDDDPELGDGTFLQRARDILERATAG